MQVSSKYQSFPIPSPHFLSSLLPFPRWAYKLNGPFLGLLVTIRISKFACKLLPSSPSMFSACLLPVQVEHVCPIVDSFCVMPHLWLRAGEQRSYWGLQCVQHSALVSACLADCLLGIPRMALLPLPKFC